MYSFRSPVSLLKKAANNLCCDTRYEKYPSSSLLTYSNFLPKAQFFINSAADSQSHAFRVNIVQLLGVEGSGDDEPENVHRVGKEQTEEVRRCEHLRTLLWRKKYMSYEESN